MSGQGSAGNVLAALCSLLVPGLGQLLQARLLMALIQFILAALLWFVLLGWVILSVASADQGVFWGVPLIFLFGCVIHLWSILDAARWKPSDDTKSAGGPG